MLRRYWFEFGYDPETPLPLGVNLGCGVTESDRRRAEDLVRNVVFSGGQLPPVRRVVEDVDVSTLDRGHVLPNIGNVLVRGIWFPLGYDHMPDA